MKNCIKLLALLFSASLLAAIILSTQAQSPIEGGVQLSVPIPCYRPVYNGVVNSNMIVCSSNIGPLEVTSTTLTNIGGTNGVSISFRSSSYYNYQLWRTSDFCKDTWHLVVSNAPMRDFVTTIVDFGATNLNNFYRVGLSW